MHRNDKMDEISTLNEYNTKAGKTAVCVCLKLGGKGL